MNSAITKEYQEHKVFDQLKDYSGFYKSLSYSIMPWATMGALSWINLDTYVYSSIQGTLESLHDVLKKGRINDAYALLRKYYDSTIINIYSNLYLEDHFSIENFVVKKIDNWLKGKETIPSFAEMSKYITTSTKLSGITKLLHSSDRYKHIRKRCNDHMHYNYYRHVLLNDNEIYLEDNRIKALNKLLADIEDIFLQHISYIFYLKGNYMMSSDHNDALELGQQPEEGSEFWVSPPIQEMLNKIMKSKHPDIYMEIKNKTGMQLD